MSTFEASDNGDICSILVYIGLIVVILFILGMMYSLVCKCMKIFNEEIFPSTWGFDDNYKVLCWSVGPKTKRCGSTNLLMGLSSVSSLTSYHGNKSLTRPSSTRLIQCQTPSPDVWKSFEYFQNKKTFFQCHNDRCR